VPRPRRRTVRALTLPALPTLPALGGQRARRRLGSLLAAAGLAVATSVAVRPSTATQFEGVSTTWAQTLTTRSAFFHRAVVVSAPIAYWRLGETSGTTAADQMGHVPMTLMNTPTLGRPGALRGDPDAGIAVNGTSPASYGTATSGTLAISGPLTVAAWTKVTTIGGNRRLVFKGISTNLNYLLSWSTDSHDMRFLVDPVVGSRITAAATWPTDHGWSRALPAAEVLALYRDGTGT
jgi:hypothetical protein